MLSIIIVNYRSASLVEDCLKSIGEQHIDSEVIIVDNNSGDDEREMLKSMCSTFSFVSIILNSDNEGFSKATNRGLAKSRGNYILFLNPDTFLLPDCLKNLLTFLKTTSRIGCVIPKLWMDKQRNFVLPPSFLPSPWQQARNRACMSSRLFLSICRRTWLRKALAYWNALSPLSVEAVSGAFMMTTRQVLDKVGSFDERFPLYFEDSDLCRRIKRAGFDIYYCPNAEAVHYYNQSAKNSPESARKFASSQTLYMEKYYSPSSLRFFSFLEKLAPANAKSAAKEWDFSMPIRTESGYLLFSPLSTMMPCAARKTAEQQFSFPTEFVENLAYGRYYVLVLSPYGIITNELTLEKP